ncbi:hypothetical protein EC845_1574 [Comamonas sp. BIGb0124]|nr:hypothetical protein EC845_1574 [Comamonas sp. BIGb0124]
MRIPSFASVQDRLNDNVDMTRQPGSSHLSIAHLWPPVAAMALVIALSNYLVQFPITAWLTWGAFSYPLVFLVCDLTNRAVGPAAARRVAWIGFAVAILLSLAVAPWRIALASGTAFIVAQGLDIALFNRLRQASWWKAPLAASAAASVIDTLVFFSIAFAGTAFNWLTLALGDMLVKLAMAVVLLAPYRYMLGHLQAWRPSSAS